jgi:ferredoxin-NADP reductase
LRYFLSLHASIRVDPGGPSHFKGGQYATLGVDHADKRIERTSSIVSSPYEEGLEFFIERAPQSELTPHLYKLPSGDTMLCRKVAKGRFTLDIGEWPHRTSTIPSTIWTEP